MEDEAWSVDRLPRVRDFHRFVVRGNTCKHPSPSPLFLNSDCLRYVQGGRGRGGRRIDGEKLNRSELSKSARGRAFCEYGANIGDRGNETRVKGRVVRMDRNGARSSAILYFVMELLIDEYIIFHGF